MPRIPKVYKVAQAKSAIRGIRAHFTAQTTYRLSGKPYSADQLVALFQSHIDAIGEVDAARARLTVAVRKERALAKQMQVITPQLKATVSTLFGTKSLAFAEFGWRPPRKPGPKTLEGKVAGVEKRAARRESKER